MVPCNSTLMWSTSSWPYSHSLVATNKCRQQQQQQQPAAAVAAAAAAAAATAAAQSLLRIFHYMIYNSWVYL